MWGNYSLFTIVCFIFASVAVGSYNREKMFPFTRVALGLNVTSHAFFLKTLSSIALLGFKYNSKRAESSFALSQGPLLLCKCLYVFPLFFCFFVLSRGQYLYVKIFLYHSHLLIYTTCLDRFNSKGAKLKYKISTLLNRPFSTYNNSRQICLI